MRAPKISPFRLKLTSRVSSMPERASPIGGHCQQARNALLTSPKVLSLIFDEGAGPAVAADAATSAAAPKQAPIQRIAALARATWRRPRPEPWSSYQDRPPARPS